MKIIEPKILKGTRDFGPETMAKRNQVLSQLKAVFSLYGYQQIETPILNPAENILGKYGEEGDQLTYSFKDKGGRNVALPYDLTVPFARYFAANWGNLPLPFKRYQIQRVWRAEKPQKGRLREFYQCDIDVIGADSLLVEAEIALLISQIFQELKFENLRIMFNSRKLMNEILESFKVSKDKFLEVIRIIDKISKIGEEKVIKELGNLKISNAKDLIELLKPEENTEKTLEKLKNHDLKEIKEFLEYCKILEIPQKVLKFNPTLARGLDYYTGFIFEVIDLENPDLGSICGGGRYDNLCALFSTQKFSGIGVSLGFERIMIAMEKRNQFQNLDFETDVLVTVFDENSTQNSLNIYRQLLDEGINSEIYFGEQKLKKQLNYADKKEIPFVVIQGPEEKNIDLVTLKSMQTGKQKILPISQLITYLKNYEKN